MKTRVIAIGTLAVAAGISVAAVAPWRQVSLHPRAAAAGTSHLHAYGVRGSQASGGVQNPKLDSALADISRHLGQVRADHAVEDLHVLHPAARFAQPAGAGEPL